MLIAVAKILNLWPDTKKRVMQACLVLVAEIAFSYCILTY